MGIINPKEKPLQLLISLHDITPFHSVRIKKAEKLFSEWGIQKITYLFIPQYHGSYLASESPDFIKDCHSPHPFEVQWYLHGYHHLEKLASISGPNSLPINTAQDFWKRKFLTAGEGEFLSLDVKAMDEKLTQGLAEFRKCLQQEPKGFIAPAWLFNEGLFEALAKMNLAFTEDHRKIYRIENHRSLPSPVITWATRTILRKYGSLIVCPALSLLTARDPILRVAMHPFDFDHPETVANIGWVIKNLISKRNQVFMDEIAFD